LSDPGICVVRAGQGERVPVELATRLRPVDPATFHIYRLPANSDVKLHYHDFDEYWWFVEGQPRVTLRAPGGEPHTFHLGAGDLVACVAGVEHTLWADHELVYHQYCSVRHGDERLGHLTRSRPSQRTLGNP
jgi:mannose-6-phosphate isomerase-like protein (cupin superfamily)